jgi:hypothetical protein
MQTVGPQQPAPPGHPAARYRVPARVSEVQRAADGDVPAVGAANARDQPAHITRRRSGHVIVQATRHRILPRAAAEYLAGMIGNPDGSRRNVPVPLMYKVGTPGGLL